MHELILLESVEGLGRPGDQVKVKPGFARNYLLPKGKAVPVSAEAIRHLGKLKAKADAEERAMVSSMEEMAAKIGGANVAILARATEEGHLFGSVTEKDIHGALVAAGWDVPLRAVRLEAHIKEAGLSEVELHLYGEITTTIEVDVQPVDAEGHPIQRVEAESAPASEGQAGDGASEADGADIEVPDEASAAPDAD